MPGFGVGGGGCRVLDGEDDAQGGGLLPLDWGIFDPVSFELSGKALVQADVNLGVRGGGGVSGVVKFIQEVGCCNFPLCLINRLLPNLVHLVLGVLGVADPVPI